MLAEAARIDRKHLLTLEPGISTHQTKDMIRNSLQLVVPQGLHATYIADQAGWLMNVRGFLDLVAVRVAA